MPRDAFSDVMRGDRRGAKRPVDTGANDPYIILLKQPADPWRVDFLRHLNKLCVNIGTLGLTDADEEGRHLIVMVCALVLTGIRENPEISDEDLDELAVYAVETFSAIPPELRLR